MDMNISVREISKEEYLNGPKSVLEVHIDTQQVHAAELPTFYKKSGRLPILECPYCSGQARVCFEDTSWDLMFCTDCHSVMVFEYRLSERDCEYCGEEFVPKLAAQIFCDDRCAIEQGRANHEAT